MPVAIRNLTLRPLFVPLNSGAHLRLSPGEVSSAVPDVELQNNAKIDKLLLQRAIAVERQAEEAAEKQAVEPAEARGEAAEPPRESETDVRVPARRKS